MSALYLYKLLAEIIYSHVFLYYMRYVQCGNSQLLSEILHIQFHINIYILDLKSFIKMFVINNILLYYHNCYSMAIKSNVDNHPISTNGASYMVLISEDNNTFF